MVLKSRKQFITVFPYSVIVRVYIDKELSSKFQDILVELSEIAGISVVPKNSVLEEFKKNIIEEVRKNYTPDGLKDVPIIRKYRDFYWRVGIDPTKIRPASEALIRRILHDKPLPTINSAADTYNLASIKTHIAIGAFDRSKLKGDLNLRFAKENENFLGIGMEDARILKSNDIVVSDEEKIIAVYPYRDSDFTKITYDTKDTVLLFCGVPGIERRELINARDLTDRYITQFCGGEVKR